MYYMNSKRELFYSPTEAVIDRYKLTKISSEEFHIRVEELNNPAKSLEELKEDKATLIQREKKRIKNNGFLIDGTFFDSDEAAQIAYLQFQMQLAQDSDYSCTWKASAGNWITMDAALFAKVMQAGEAHIQAVFAWQATKETEIAQATTAQELEAVEVTYAAATD